MAQFDFDNHNTLYATHGLHAFAAKCPPQLARYALRQYSRVGDLLLDPMVGSGTALVEARLMGRNGLGFDIDPLARLIAQVKCQVLDDDELEVAHHLVLVRATEDLESLKTGSASPAIRARCKPPDFHNRDYWFDPDVSMALTVLAYHVAHAPMSSRVRDFLWVAFSSVILARTSVANARDIIHSRHHHWKPTQRPDVLGRFDARMGRMRKQMADFRERCQCANHRSWARAEVGDARRLDVEDGSVDIVFSSPPYVTALDYPRAHFLAIPWLQPVLGIDLATYMANAATYVGSERGRLREPLVVDDWLAKLDTATSVIGKLSEVSPRQAKLCHRYFLDMHAILAEVARALKDGRYAVIVVCPSHIRQVSVPTHLIFAEMGRHLGLRLEQQHVRTISERRRVMPYMSAFGSRMSTEYILILRKE